MSYATAVGDDALSAGLLERWAAEGLTLGLVRRITGRLPGLYWIETDAGGERRFSYWRDTSAARAYFEAGCQRLPTPLEARRQSGTRFTSAASAWPSCRRPGANASSRLAHSLRRRGAQVVFDNNYRPRLWPDVDEARRCFVRAFECSSLALVTADDHQALFGLATPGDAVAAAHALPCPEVVVKRGAAATLVRTAGGARQPAPTESVTSVVDTTAAGDSFAAGYLAHRLAGAAPLQSARFGNRLAARVIQQRGALIAPALMADLLH
ncbi:MAG: sugar kinase [Comamonadaceae bacterium]|nr:sugar kinase [Comamonadaceae bacterium]